MKVGEIVKVTGGRLICGSPDADIDLSRISTDSRSIKRGELFLALSGPNFSGSDFVKDALKKGAAGAISERHVSCESGKGKIIIKVRNGTKALQDIAACHRMKFDIPVICITGSNGKTTVKDMAAFVLSRRYNVLKNEGTRNNHIGVPQTLLKLKPGHDVCVMELGTNHKGEIGTLAAIARPTVAVITNIGPSHLEFLKDLRGVYKEKKDILKHLPKGGIAVVNGDDEFLSGIRCAKARLIRFGLKKTNAFNAEVVSTDKDRIAFILNSKEGVELKLLGLHSVYNALAAIAIASLFDINHDTVKKALADFKPTTMRMNLIRLGGIDIINDSYNSNPLSMQTAVDAIKQRPARARWVVSGDMLELGRKSEYFHRMVGRMIASAGIEGLLTFGELSRYTLAAALGSGMDEENLWHCATHDEIADILREVVQEGDLVLVKGSRSMRMEKVVELLAEDRS